MTETTAAIADQAREGCPAWCTSHYRETYGHGFIMEGHEVKRCAGGILVQVLQSLDGSATTLYVQTAGFPLDQAPAVAQLLRMLGHGDEAAATVEELAALAGGSPPIS